MCIFDSIRSALEILCKPQNVDFAVVNIKETWNRIDNNFNYSEILTENEMKTFEKYRNPKRKAEWLSGRIAVKEISALKSKKAVEVFIDENGAPYTADGKYCISITHSGTVAIAVQAEFPLGIDLEFFEQRPHSLVRYFLSENEEMLLREKNEEERMKEINRLWTCKEAISKVGGWGGTINFKEIDCCSNPVKVRDQIIYHKSAFTAGSFVVTLATSKKTGATHG